MSSTAPAKVVLLLVVVASLVVAGVLAWAILSPAWNRCASYVDGVLVEHRCDEPVR